MKKSLAKKVTLSILAGAVLMSSSVVWAAGTEWDSSRPGRDITDINPCGSSGTGNGWVDSGIYYAPEFENSSVASASNNKVVFNSSFSGTVNVDFAGGYSSGSGAAEKNTVTISGGTFNGTNQKIYGGYSYDGNAGGGTADKGNKVIINGGTFENVYVDGGYSNTGDAKHNEVVISGVDDGSAFNAIRGGEAYGGTGNANYNRVTLSAENAEYEGNIYGGYSYGGNTEGNIVTIGGGTFNGTYQTIYGGNSSGDAGSDTANAGNKVIINGGKFNGTLVYGGYSNTGDAKHNEVVISDVDNGSTFYYVYGGKSGDGGNGSANYNRVTLSAENATYESSICGGNSDSGNATGNIVTISGGKFGGDHTVASVYGGFSVSGSATGNTVNISGDANLEKANLYGGYSSSNGTVSDNVLNVGVNSTLKTELEQKGIDVTVGAWNKNKVKSIQGFDVINFAYVNWNTTKPAVEVTEKLIVNNTKVTVGEVHVASGDTTFAANQKMTLIRASGIVKENPNYQPGSSVPAYIDATIENDSIEATKIDGTSTNIFYGVAEVYKASIKQEANNGKQDINLVLGDDDTKVDNPNTNSNTGGSVSGGGTPQPERNNQVLVLGESRAAAVAFTNQSSELIETGLNALARDNEKDTKVFAAVYGNHSEYETGSHVNVNGWSGIVGIGKTNDNGLTVGAFFENGEGNYSTHNIFTADYIRGDGEACYNGGGFLVRKDNANGVYAEASLRAGNLQNELRNAVRNGSELTGYDVDTFYYGAHVGIGKVIARGNDGDSLDVYGKFIYTYHDGETFDIGGTATKFDSVESERLRLGFRLNEVQTNKLSMYYGAAWEYEFNGDAHDKIASFDLETPSLEGSTVIGEIGAHYKASERWSIDLNGRAYVGQREGFSGSVQANYSF